MRWTLAIAVVACSSRGPAAPPPAVQPAWCPPSAPVAPTIAVADVIPRPEPRLSVGVVDKTPIRAIDGPLRAEVTGGAITFAADRFATSIVRIKHLQNAWVFVTLDGVVASSDTYLGPLRRVGQAKPGASTDYSRCRGRMTIIGDAIETTDGVAPLQPLPSQPPGKIARAAFRDAATGVFVREGGDAFVTQDGGRSYQRIDLGDAAITDVACEDDVLVLETSRGRRRVDGTRTVSLPPQSEARLEAERIAAVDARIAVEDRMRAGELSRFASLTAPTSGEIIGGKPVIAVSAPRTAAALVRLDTLSLDDLTRRVRETASPHTQMGERVSDAMCAIRPWGPNLALLCPDGLDRYEPTTGRSTRVATDRDGWRGPHLTTSSDGIHAMWACEDRKRGRAWCIVTPGGVVKVASTDREPFAMIDGRFAFRDTGGLSLVDPVTGASESIAVPPPEPRASVGFARASDGGVIAVAKGWFARMHGGAFDWRRLPDGAEAIDFVDERRAIARAPETTAIWASDDGGGSWHAVPLRVDGALGETRIDRREVAYGTRCVDSHCTLDERIVVTFGALDLGGAHVLAAYDCPAAPPPARADDRWLACAVAATRTIAPRGRGEDYLLDEHGRTEIARDNLFATLAVGAGGTRSHWDLTWAGRDAFGPYHRVGAGEVPSPRERDVSYQINHASREGISIYADNYYWVPVDGAPFRIETDDELLAAPTGEIAVISGAGEEAHHAWRIVVRGRAGNVIARRELPYTYHPMRLGWIDGRFVVQILDDDGRQRTAIPVRGSREPLALRDAWFHAPICNHPPTANAMILAAAGMVDIDQYARTVERIVVEPGDAPCLAAVVLAKFGQDGSQVYATAAADGALHTEYERSDRVLDLTCRRN